MSKRIRLLDSDTAGIPRENHVLNINGASLIKVPDWIPNPLGRYYLYFAHHAGDFIRLAYSDDLHGQWTVYNAGALHLNQTICIGHIASPDVHIMSDTQQIRMYFHGPVAPEDDTMPDLAKQHPIVGHQRTLVASSSDGINFTLDHKTVLGSSYFRVWQWRNHWYALGMPGILYRSHDEGMTFEVGKILFSKDFRHAAVAREDDTLFVYYSQVGDCPERILLSKIKLSDDWNNWKPTPAIDVLRPVETWEGADEPLEPSARGLATTPVNQLRDPAIFVEDDHRYLLYSFAGEQGIALTQLL
jgi:hypothetical protein